MSDFALYNYFRSSTSYRVRIAMHLKSLSFQYHPVHLLNNGGEQHTAEYRQLNAAGEVPTLVHGNFKVAQSMVICEYLDQIRNTPRLFPEDVQKAASVRQFCENINCAHALTNLKTMQYLEKNAGLSAEARGAWLQHWGHQNFAVIEKWIAQHGGTYCFGDEVTAADAFLLPLVFWAQRFHIGLENYPAVRRVVANCEKLEAFRKAHPYRQVDTPPELKID
ncbi:MAG: maleylacetoacetate isomerase [Bdellovibrionaceae bacterium]|nr:maleylacetoacetate isomerase [Pseudobdellovibrionaceae bacterium]